MCVTERQRQTDSSEVSQLLYSICSYPFFQNHFFYLFYIRKKNFEWKYKMSWIYSFKIKYIPILTCSIGPFPSDLKSKTKTGYSEKKHTFFAYNLKHNSIEAVKVTPINLLKSHDGKIQFFLWKREGRKIIFVMKQILNRPTCKDRRPFTILDLPIQIRDTWF